MNGYEPILNTVSYGIMSSEKPAIVPEFNGTGTIKFMLLEDQAVEQRFLEITFSAQVIMTGFKFAMPDDKVLNSFTLLVEEAGIEFPGQLTHWGVSKL